MRPVAGIHHVTAIAGAPQPNLDFYTGLLGLRLVKLTVNYDDPATYHVYFGDRTGRPGTLLTFFPWPGAPRGRAGKGAASAVAYAVPPESVGWWERRLAEHGLEPRRTERFGEATLSFEDPDGMTVELVGSAPGAAPDPWAQSAVPAANAITGFHGVTLAVEGYERTAGLLTETMGFESAGETGNRFRFRARGAGASGALGGVVDVLCEPDGRPAKMGAGAIHHVAFRAPDDAEQREQRRRLAELGFNVTPVVDRTYFHSIYFREPGGVLFEMATDVPGFATDEAADTLGSKLVLPAHLEPRRAAITAVLPRLVLPSGLTEGAR